jgi:hypothetical protein
MAVDSSALGSAAGGAAAGAGAGPLGAVAGAGLGLLGGILGGNASKKAAAEAAAISEANYQRNKALLESVGIPSVEAQQIALQNPEYVGDLVAEMQGNTGLKDIKTDPQLRQNQMKMLAELQGLSETGLGTVDRIALDEAQTEATSADKSRRAAILSQMAQRGTMDSGAALAAQLQSSEAANQQAMQQSQNIAKQSATNRMNAITSLASQSGAMEQRDYGRQADAATAQDAIQKFNVGTRNTTNASNLTNKQNISNAATSNANEQEMYNKGLLQQDYNNRMSKAKSIAGLNSDNAGNQASAALTAGAGKANMFGQVGQALGNVTRGVVDYYGNKAPTTSALGSADAINGRNAEDEYAKKLL